LTYAWRGNKNKSRGGKAKNQRFKKRKKKKKKHSQNWDALTQNIGLPGIRPRIFKSKDPRIRDPL